MHDRKHLRRPTGSATRTGKAAAVPARRPRPPALSIDETFDEGRDPYNNCGHGVAPRYRKD